MSLVSRLSAGSLFRGKASISFFFVKTYLGFKKKKNLCLLAASCFIRGNESFCNSDCSAALFTFTSSHVSQPFSCLQAGLAVKD